MDPAMTTSASSSLFAAAEMRESILSSIAEKRASMGSFREEIAASKSAFVTNPLCVSVDGMRKPSAGAIRVVFQSNLKLDPVNGIYPRPLSRTRERSGHRCAVVDDGNIFN